MKINEVEKLTGVKIANIRYYEKMGLLSPARRESGYRDYSEEDIERLRRIKMLRLIDIPIVGIKDILSGEVSMDYVINKRLEEIVEEESELKESKEICQNILHNCHSFDDLNETLVGVDEKDKIWVERLEQIWEEDIDKPFLVKGALMMLAVVALCSTRFLMGELSVFYVDPSNQSELFVLRMVGIFFMCYGVLWAIIEGYSNSPLLWAGTHKTKSGFWAAPGFGILTNGFTLFGLGAGIAASSLAGLAGLYVLGVAVVGGIRAGFMHRRAKY